MSETEEQISLSYYDFQEVFTAHEAACLIMGVDPGYPSAKRDLYKRPVDTIMDAMRTAYERTYYIVKQGIKWCDENNVPYPPEPWQEEGKFLPDETFWDDWLVLADNPKVFDTPPTELETLVGLSFEDQFFRREDITAWLRSRQYGDACYFWTEEDRKREADAARLPSAGAAQQDGGDKPLDPRERSTLYKIILAMAMDGYGYSADGKPSPIPREISEATEREGIPVNDDTIRSHLKAAARLLHPQRQKI